MKYIPKQFDKVLCDGRVYKIMIKPVNPENDTSIIYGRDIETYQEKAFMICDCVQVKDNLL
jgi:hypothetical protein